MIVYFDSSELIIFLYAISDKNLFIKILAKKKCEHIRHNLGC